MLNIFKKKASQKAQNEPKAERQVTKSEKRISGSWKVLKFPHIAEKSTELAKKNQYVFKVFPDTNKPEVKRAVSSKYGVDVVKVNIVNVPHKKRRLGKIAGFRKAYKKAIVKIKEGQKIDLMPR
ncbi:MAG: 50S ribosomal protein L23 [bacterium]